MGASCLMIKGAVPLSLNCLARYEIQRLAVSHGRNTDAGHNPDPGAGEKDLRELSFFVFALPGVSLSVRHQEQLFADGLLQYSSASLFNYGKCRRNAVLLSIEIVFGKISRKDRGKNG